MKDGMTDKEKRDWIEKRIEFIGEHEKIMQRIKDKSEVAKEVNLVVDLDIHRKLLKEAKLSQRKEDEVKLKEFAKKIKEKIEEIRDRDYDDRLGYSPTKEISCWTVKQEIDKLLEEELKYDN